jgi:membrane-associated protein
MGYRRFLTFTVVGALLWVPSMVGLGYILTPVLDQPLKSVFGADFETARHIEKVIILVVLVSISPGLYAGAKNWLAKRRAARGGTNSVAEEVNTGV